MGFPLCYSLFSSEEIELHASNCSGDDHDSPHFIDLDLQVDDEADDAMDGCEEEIPRKISVTHPRGATREKHIQTVQNVYF